MFIPYCGSATGEPQKQFNTDKDRWTSWEAYSSTPVVNGRWRRTFIASRSAIACYALHRATHVRMVQHIACAKASGVYVRDAWERDRSLCDVCCTPHRMPCGVASLPSSRVPYNAACYAARRVRWCRAQCVQHESPYNRKARFRGPVVRCITLLTSSWLLPF